MNLKILKFFFKKGVHYLKQIIRPEINAYMRGIIESYNMIKKRNNFPNYKMGNTVRKLFNKTEIQMMKKFIVSLISFIIALEKKSRSNRLNFLNIMIQLLTF